MDRPFALALKCYGGFVLLADCASGARLGRPSRLWPITSECAAVGHGAMPTVLNVGQAVLVKREGNETIDIVFPQIAEALTQYCQANGVNQSIGYIFAGFDAARLQKFQGWVWDGNASVTHNFDLPLVPSFFNPIGHYLSMKVYSFDQTADIVSRLGLYTLLQTRTILQFPIDEFAEVGWLTSSLGLDIKPDEYVRERLHLLQNKGEELRMRCQQLFAKDHA